MSKKGSIFIDGLESYIDVNLISRPFSIMKEVEEYAKNKQIPILSPMSGNILSYLVSITNSTNILELGTGIGYSTLWMMSTKKSLKITTIDRNQDDQKIAEQFIFKIKAPNQEIRFIHAQCLEYCKTHELDSYDFIFIDCPPSLGLLTINALTAADAVLIPVQCEYYALEGLSQLLNTVKFVKNSFNPDLNIEGYLLTMFDSRLKLSQQVEGELRKYFGDKVFDTKIFRNVKLGEAPSFGKPIILYDPQSTGSKNHIELSIELLKRNGVDEINGTIKSILENG